MAPQAPLFKIQSLPIQEKRRRVSERRRAATGLASKNGNAMQRKSLIALLTTCTGALVLSDAAKAEDRSGIALAPAHAADARAQGRSLRYDLSASMTNTGFIRVANTAPGGGQGVNLGGGANPSSQAVTATTTGPKKPQKQAIYGHNVSNPPVDDKKTPPIKPQAVIIYNGTITSEPTNSRK